MATDSAVNVGPGEPGTTTFERMDHEPNKQKSHGRFSVNGMKLYVRDDSAIFAEPVSA